MPGGTGQHCLLSTIVSVLKPGATFLSIANDSETNNSVGQAILTTFAKALKVRSYMQQFPIALSLERNRLVHDTNLKISLN